MKYFVREVDGHDDDVADDLRELHDITFGSDAPQIDPSEGYWWLAIWKDCDGRCALAGFAGLHQSIGETNSGYLIRAGVLPEHQGQGLQLRLIRARERKARKLGWTVLRSDTNANPTSSNNLIKAGYRIFTPEVPWGFSTSIYWRKELR